MAQAKQRRLRLRHWDKDPIEVTFGFEEIRHYLADHGTNRNGNPWRSYEVRLLWEHKPGRKTDVFHPDGGKLLGKVEQVTESTDRPLGRGSRLRSVGRGRLAWAWTRLPYHLIENSNRPGLYARNRDDAAAELLGYQYAESVTDGI